MVKKEYPGLLRDDPEVHQAAQALAGRACELSQYLVRVLGVTKLTSIVPRGVHGPRELHAIFLQQG